MAFPKSYLTADEHTKLPPEDQARYVKHEASGGYMFGLEPVEGWRLEDVGGLSATVQKLRPLERKFKDINPDAAIAAMARVAELESEIEKGAGKLTKEEREAIKKSVSESYEKDRASWEKEKAALAKERDDYDAQIREHIVESAATAALAKFGANQRMLKPHVKQALRAVKDDSGRYQPRVFNPDGTERYSAQSGSSHLYMTAEELVSAMKSEKDFADAFPGTGSTGSGATSSRANGHGGNRIDPNLPPMERMRLARELGIK
jgi:hypothetical protein